MNRNCRRPLLTMAMGLCAALAGTFASPAQADNDRQSASARGRIVILKPVGTGVAFNTISDVLSGAFLAGQPGDAVSLLLPERTRRSRVPVEVLVLSTGSYDLGGTLGNSPSGSDKVPTNLRPAGLGEPPGNLLFLAQFN